MADDQWWFDLNTKTAVQDNKAGRVTDRLGPYAVARRPSGRCSGWRSATRLTTTTRAGTTTSSRSNAGRRVCDVLRPGASTVSSTQAGAARPGPAARTR